MWPSWSALSNRVFNAPDEKSLRHAGAFLQVAAAQSEKPGVFQLASISVLLAIDLSVPPDLGGHQDGVTDSVAVDLDQEAQSFSSGELALKRGFEIAGDGMEVAGGLCRPEQTSWPALRSGRPGFKAWPLWSNPCCCASSFKAWLGEIVCIG